MTWEDDDFFLIEIGACQKKGLEIKCVRWIVLEVGIRFLRSVKAEPDILAV